MTLVPALNQATVAQCATEEFVRICAAEGFGQVELRFEAAEGYFASRGADEWRALLRDNDVKVASLNSLEHFSLTPDSSYRLMEEKTRLMCSLCSLLGTDLLVVVPSYRRPDYSPQQVVEKTVANLGRLARVAEGFGVRLGFEPIGFPWYSVRSWETGVRIVEEVGRDDVGLVVDTWNFYLGGNRLDDLRATPVEKLWMVHLVDAPRELPPNLTNGHRLLPGEGGFPLQEFVAALRQLRYSGPLSVELFNEGLWSMPVREAVRRSLCAIETVVAG